MFIILWWVGAFLAIVAFFIPILEYYYLVSGIGWITILVISILIIFDIRRIKKEDKEKDKVEN
ncbi:MAG: hypothetical protein DA328_04790 [Nitrososphaeraceae archaeon]|nr:hypothetical protein [Nitrososphaeraceae archaeon]